MQRFMICACREENTLTIEEEQQLNFGTLFARFSATDQAQLNLSPSGVYTNSEPGLSRLVTLVKPKEGNSGYF